MSKTNYSNLFIPMHQKGLVLKGTSWEYLKGDDGNYYSRRKGSTTWIKNNERTGLNEVKALFNKRGASKQKPDGITNKKPDGITNVPTPTNKIIGSTSGTDKKPVVEKTTPVKETTTPKPQVRTEEKPKQKESKFDKFLDFLMPPWMKLFGNSEEEETGNFGGGMSGGGGAGGSFTPEEPKPEEEEVTQTQLLLANEETFNQAFARARREKKKVFEFNGKLYNTDLDDTPGRDHWTAGQKRRRVSGVAPVYIETKKNGKNNESTLKMGIASDPDGIIPIGFKKGGSFKYLNLFNKI